MFDTLHTEASPLARRLILIAGLSLVLLVSASLTPTAKNSDSLYAQATASLNVLAPAPAEAASRTWYGFKLNWPETNAVAYADIPRAKFILKSSGLAGRVIDAFIWTYREAARWSIFQRKCLGFTWVGSQVPGVSC